MVNRHDGLTTATVLLVLFVAAAGCSSGEPFDTSWDTAIDTLVDNGSDGAFDPGYDPGYDPGTDPAYDPYTDPAYDPGTDPGYDPGTDPGYDPGTDPGYDPGTDPGTGSIVGDPCYSSTTCTGVPGAGRVCLTNLMGYITFPGGYCSATCTSAADCGPGAQCVNLADLGMYCLKQCTSGVDCRTAETYTCAAVPGTTGTFCIPPISAAEGADY